jgi:hypothetical protein
MARYVDIQIHFPTTNKQTNKQSINQSRTEKENIDECSKFEEDNKEEEDDYSFSN